MHNFFLLYNNNTPVEIINEANIKKLTAKYPNLLPE
jgi:hypothetical protein